MGIKKEVFSNNKNYKMFFFKLKSLRNHLYNDHFIRLHKNLIQAAKNDRNKWLLVKETYQFSIHQIQCSVKLSPAFARIKTEVSKSGLTSLVLYSIVY